jgi:hypothetical protein
VHQRSRVVFIRNVIWGKGDIQLPKTSWEFIPLWLESWDTDVIPNRYILPYPYLSPLSYGVLPPVPFPDSFVAFCAGPSNNHIYTCQTEAFSRPSPLGEQSTTRVLCGTVITTNCILSPQTTMPILKQQVLSFEFFFFKWSLLVCSKTTGQDSCSKFLAPWYSILQILLFEIYVQIFWMTIYFINWTLSWLKSSFLCGSRKDCTMRKKNKT